MKPELSEGLQIAIHKFRSNDLKKFIEKYCSSCRAFLSEERDGSISTFDPSQLGVPDLFIYKLESGSVPYEFRRCDATYEPDGKGGCKNYVQGKLLLFKRRKK